MWSSLYGPLLHLAADPLNEHGPRVSFNDEQLEEWINRCLVCMFILLWANVDCFYLPSSKIFIVILLLKFLVFVSKNLLGIAKL